MRTNRPHHPSPETRANALKLKSFADLCDPEVRQILDLPDPSRTSILDTARKLR